MLKLQKTKNKNSKDKKMCYNAVFKFCPRQEKENVESSICQESISSKQLSLLSFYEDCEPNNSFQIEIYGYPLETNIQIPPKTKQIPSLLPLNSILDDEKVNQFFEELRAQEIKNI